ncbi:unknown [Blautia sp. CAG:257]|nr:unknown [Blautia sp. CAG:257]
MIFAAVNVNSITERAVRRINIKSNILLWV